MTKEQVVSGGDDWQHYVCQLMQDGQLCLLSPGKGGGHIQFKKGKKTKAKTSWVECGASRVRMGEGGAREHCSFYCTLLKS